MTPGMKMMMLDRMGKPDRIRNGRKVEIEYEDTRDRMEPENRFRDRRGREHYNNGRFAPMRSEMDESPRGSMNWNRYDRETPRGDHWVPPIHEGTGYRYEDGSRMIGFYGGGSTEVQNGGYRSDGRYESRNELEHNRSPRMAGHAEALSKPMDRETAKEWVRGMKNSDGSSGEHWSFEQTSQVMRQKGIDCNPAEWYAIMNAVWSDYGKIAEKYGVDKVDFWADLTKAWLMDKDAHADKAALYYECIVK